MQETTLGFTQHNATQQVELLAPAGNLTKLKIALQYGADAVYGGVSHFSLRNRAGKSFTYEDFAQGIEYAHNLGKKVYVTINGFPFNSQIESLKDHIAKMRDLSPDAFIIAAPGVVRLAKSIAPNIPIHLSTQANVLNVLDAGVYYDMGVKRIVAAREVSLSDCEAIKRVLPDLELEVFVHGSMCFAFSGRCLISALQHGRVPNRGSCANDCRFDYEYFVKDSNGNLIEFDSREMYVKNPDNDVFLRLQEEEGIGTHIFNAKDLNLASHIHHIVQSGVINALKIEGRTKSTYYAGITARTYRLALQDYAKGIARPSLYQYELHTLKNRGFTDGYIIHRPFARLDTQNHATAISEGSYQVCAEVDESGLYCLCKHTIRKGDLLEIIAPLSYYRNTQFGVQSHAIWSASSVEAKNAAVDLAHSQGGVAHGFQGNAANTAQCKESKTNASKPHGDITNAVQSQNSRTHDSQDSTQSAAQPLDSENAQCAANAFSIQDNSTEHSLTEYSLTEHSLTEHSLAKHNLLAEQSNENGLICCIDGRYYMRLHKIILQDGKELEAIHSGNTNPIRLPFALPPLSFLRVQLEGQDS